MKSVVEQSVWSEAERNAWRLPAELTVSQWADRHRVLDPRSSAESGPWRTDRTAYLRGIMDAFSDPEVEVVVVQKPPQSAGTEGILNMIGYTIDHDPGPALLVEPRDEDCDYVSENRLKPMIEASSALQSHTTGRIWDLSKDEFHFDRMTLYFAASNSPAGLAAKPIRYLFLDEVNKYPPFTGKEASPIDLAIKRTITYWDRKIVIISTPTTTDGHITIIIGKTRIHDLYIPCPHCGEYSIWKFEQLKIPKTLRDPDKIRQTTGEIYYECEHCNGRIDEIRKDELVAKGKWVAEGQKIDAEGNITGTAKRSKRRSGFRYSALISPWVFWTEVMAQWFEANTEEGIAIGKLLDFKNSILAIAYTETAIKTEVQELIKNKGEFSRGTVPDDCLVLMAGADYHEDARGMVRIDYEVRGFGYGERNFVISSGAAHSWEQLEAEVLFNPFPWSNPDGPRGTESELAVMQLFIDSGYKPDEVYSFCLRHPAICKPTKGASSAQRTPLVITNLEKTTGHRRRQYRGMQLVMIDTDFFKNKVHGWASRQPGQAGSTEFYAEIPDYYFREFTNEQKVKTRSRYGQIIWRWKPVSSGAATHHLDTAVNAAAAGYFRRVQYLRRPAEQRQSAAAVTRQPVRRKRPTKRTHQGFLDNLPRL